MYFLYMCGVKTSNKTLCSSVKCDPWPVPVHILILLLQHLNVNQIQVVVRRCSSPNVTEETTYFLPRNPVVDAGTNTDPPVVCCPLLHRFCPCPPRGLLASITTKGKKCGALLRSHHRNCAACPSFSKHYGKTADDMSIFYTLNYRQQQCCR